MNCQKAQSLLSAYLDRELSIEERRQLRLHLAACDECADELHELEELKGALGYLTVTSVPPVIPWLQAHLTENALDIEAFVWQYPWFRRTCAIAALLLLFGLGSWLFVPQGQNEPGRRSTLDRFPETSWINIQGPVR